MVCWLLDCGVLDGSFGCDEGVTVSCVMVPSGGTPDGPDGSLIKVEIIIMMVTKVWRQDSTEFVQTAVKLSWTQCSVKLRQVFCTIDYQRYIRMLKNGSPILNTTKSKSTAIIVVSIVVHVFQKLCV